MTTGPQHAVDTDDGDTDGERQSGVLMRAVAAFAVGLLMLVVAFANLAKVSGWADNHGAVPVYLGFFLVMSIAGRLFWWGIDTTVTRVHG